jgi:hypothetical protein
MRKAVSLQAALEVVKERQEEFMAHVTRKLVVVVVVDQNCHGYHSRTDIGPRHAQAVAGFHPCPCLPNLLVFSLLGFFDSLGLFCLRKTDHHHEDRDVTQFDVM